MRFDYQMFTNLLKNKWIKRAEEYRDSFKTKTWIEIKEEFVENKETWINEKKNAITEEQKEVLGSNTNEEQNNDITVENNSETETKEEYSSDDLKELLKKAGVKFHPATWDVKLLEKCIENNLL